MIGAALISSLLPAAAFLAVFVAGLFARSVVEHELEIWRRSHPHNRSRRPGASPHDYYDEALGMQAANYHDETLAGSTPFVWPVRDEATVRREIELLNSELETRVA